VVPARHAGRLLRGDQLEEHLGRAVHHVSRERVAEHHDAGSVEQGPGQFASDLRGVRQVAGIDQDVVGNARSVRIVGEFGLLLDQRPEVPKRQSAAVNQLVMTSG
jgi:hypothetical protein